jgi:predicted DNA-binding WGR domain protein
MRFENPFSGRYYQLRTTQDLWGNWCVIKTWGGIGSNRGQIRTISADSMDACIQEFERTKKRLKRGYVRTDGR